jgi:hypothetical protein
MPRVILKSGVVVEGDGPALYETLRALGMNAFDNGLHYLSATKGVLLIRDMDTKHLRNAILKQYREWLEGLTKDKDMSDATVLHHLNIGPQAETMVALVEEFASRVRG